MRHRNIDVQRKPSLPSHMPWLRAKAMAGQSHQPPCGCHVLVGMLVVRMAPPPVVRDMQLCPASKLRILGHRDRALRCRGLPLLGIGASGTVDCRRISPLPLRSRLLWLCCCPPLHFPTSLSDQAIIACVHRLSHWRSRELYVLVWGIS